MSEGGFGHSERGVVKGEKTGFESVKVVVN